MGSLADYARTARYECWTCNSLPPELLAELNETRRTTRIGPDSVIRWLIEEHGWDRQDIKRGSINYHFQSGHHLEAK